MELLPFADTSQALMRIVVTSPHKRMNIDSVTPLVYMYESNYDSLFRNPSISQRRIFRGE